MDRPSNVTRLAGIAILGALALSACDATTFNNDFSTVNNNLKTVNTASALLSNTALPAAAMATNLATVGLINSISQNANIIAVGAGNYSTLDTTASGTGGIQPVSTLDDSTHTGTLRTVGSDGKVVVDASYHFERTVDPATHALHYAITNFVGKASGFDITVNGTFDYTPSSANSAQMACQVSGSLKSGDVSLNVDNLSFNTPVPLPANEANLGNLSMSQDKDGQKSSFSCDVSVQNNQVQALGTLKNDKGTVIDQFVLTPAGIKVAGQ